MKLETKYVLSLDLAKEIVERAVNKAQELQVGGAIAVVDDSGNLIFFQKLDGTMPAASNIAIGKAATSAVFKRPTILLEKLIHEKRQVMLGLNGITNTPYVPLMGAYPICCDGQIIGAVSVAGAETGENDEIIAKYTSEIHIDNL